jgi:crossover junction endodeoxyribonuclease RusA
MTAALHLDGTWVLELPIGLPLTMNKARTLHHQTYGKLIKQIRAVARDAALDAAIPSLARCSVQMYYQPPDRRRRDADGLVASLKPICDGLVDALVVVDDTPDLMVKLMPVIEPAGRPARVWVVVTALEAAV